MFSTNDGNMHRSLRIYVSGPQRSEELLLKGDLEELAARAQMFPGNFLLEKLARRIIQDQKRKNLPIDTVRIEVWRTEFQKGNLYPSLTRIRDYEWKEKS
jgi:hypothetical protein